MMKGSSYLNSTPRGALGRPRRFFSLASVFLIFAVLFGAVGSLPVIDSLISQSAPVASGNSGPSAITEANAFFCADPAEGNLGWGMDNANSWRSGSAWYPHSDTRNRVLTTQEAFGNGIGFTNFNGAGEGSNLLWIPEPMGLPESGEPVDGLESVTSLTGNTPEGEGTEGWFQNFNSSRAASKCVTGNVGAMLANGVLGITTGVTNLMGGIATFAFDPNFICEPNKPTATCIDLVGIIGGSGRTADEGIIGQLTSSIYFPLLGLAALLVGIWIVINGIAKRQFRETFLGVLWSVVVAILGTALLLNPLMLAKAPMVVSNALASCVIGAFSGSGGCDGSSGTGSGSTDEPTAYCVASSSRTNFMDQAAITMTSMSCELWKAFVLQPYAQGSFGVPLDQLDTNISGTVANKLVAKNPGFSSDSSTFCVNTRVNGVLDEQFNGTLQLSGGRDICNLAIYQAYLGVNASAYGGDDLPSQGAIDARWLKLAQVAASDQGMYNFWAPSDMHFGQLGLALIGLFSAILAAVVVLVVSAFSLAFYVTAILMIAFAPFFLLAGVHPGKGRKIMTGWIGQVLSNVMKYAASAIFLVITVALYGAVLSNVSNPGAILIFMIVLTVALLMYRREIVDMIGVIDLGGEKLSNKFAEKTMDRVRNTGKTAMAAGAGMTAGAIASGGLNPFRVENWNPANMARNMGTTLAAGHDAGKRSIKSRPGALSEIMQASDRISSDNRKDMVDQSRAARTTADQAEREVGKREAHLGGLTEQLTSSRTETNEQVQAIEDRRVQAEGAQFNIQAESQRLEVAESKAVEAIAKPEFKELQSILNELKALEIKATISEQAGLPEEAAAYRSQAQLLSTSAGELEARISAEDFDQGRRDYTNALATELKDPRVNPDNVEDYVKYVDNRNVRNTSAIAGAAHQTAALRNAQSENEAQLLGEIEGAMADLEQARKFADNADDAAVRSANKVTDLKAGETIRNPSVRKNADEIRRIQQDGLSQPDGDDPVAATIPATVDPTPATRPPLGGGNGDGNPDAPGGSDGESGGPKPPPITPPPVDSAPRTPVSTPQPEPTDGFDSSAPDPYASPYSDQAAEGRIKNQRRESVRAEELRKREEAAKQEQRQRQSQHDRERAEAAARNNNDLPEMSPKTAGPTRTSEPRQRREEKPRREPRPMRAPRPSREDLQTGNSPQSSEIASSATEKSVRPGPQLPAEATTAPGGKSPSGIPRQTSTPPANPAANPANQPRKDDGNPPPRGGNPFTSG